MIKITIVLQFYTLMTAPVEKRLMPWLSNTTCSEKSELAGNSVRLNTRLAISRLVKDSKSFLTINSGQFSHFPRTDTYRNHSIP